MNHSPKSKTPINTDNLSVAEIASADCTHTDTQSDPYSETYFDALYNDNTDPWEYQTRWYEKRKRDMCLAVMPQAQYSNAIELGCGNGVFSELLTRRCQALVSIDGNHNAVQLAKQRLAKLSHVKVIKGIIPNALSTIEETLLATYPLSEDSLSGKRLANKPPFDLIVVSEILYYLSPNDIDAVIAWIKQNLTVGGTLLCCHWRYRIDGFAMTGETVHQRLHQSFNGATDKAEQQVAFTHQSKLVDTDFLLDVWQHASDSVAMQENLI